MGKKILIFGIAFAFLIVLSGCGNNSNANGGVTGEYDIKELVNDYILGNRIDPIASINSTHLIVVDNEENKYQYDLPEDEFFVSIAPYFEQTHPCDIHSLTTCRGELAEEDFNVYIEDTKG